MRLIMDISDNFRETRVLVQKPLSKKLNSRRRTMDISS